MAEVDYIEQAPEPDSDVMPDGVEEEKSEIKLFGWLDDGNLVDVLDDIQGGPMQVSADTLAALSVAEDSMKPWKRQYERALKLAKLEAEVASKTFPFEDASTVMMPFILETALDFHSRTVPEMVWARNVVAVRTYGEASPEKEARAKRMSEFMNYQVGERIRTWRKEQDKNLLSLPIVGTSYKETYFNGDEQEAASDLKFGDEVIFDHDYRTFEEAPDKFVREEYTRNEVLTHIRGDRAWQLDENKLPAMRDHPEPFKFVRALTWIDLDEDGLTEPYEVVIYEEDQQIVSVYPLYDEETIIANDDGEIVDVKMVEVFTQYQFLPDPAGGPMGMGWGILLGDMFDAINTSVRQMIDAGTLSNLAGNSGLIEASHGPGARGNRQQSGPIEVRMGELTPVSVGGNKSLAQSVVQFPYQGPNATLFQLTEWMVQQIRDMANSALNMDTNGQEAAVMYLARLQQGLKVPNSIVMRVYDCARLEFKKIAAINFKHHNNAKYNRVIDTPEPAEMRADFNPEDCDIRMAIDPSQGSDIERMQRANLVLEKAEMQAQLGMSVIPVRQATIDWLEAIKTPNVEELAPEPEPGPSPQEQMMQAEQMRVAELDEREMRIKEAKQKLDQAEALMKGHAEAVRMGLELDKTEAEIAEIYSRAFKALWEIGMAGDDPVATVGDIESRLIDKEVAPAPPVPLDSPDPNAAPATQGAAAP